MGDTTSDAPEGTIHIGSAEIRPFKDPSRAHDTTASQGGDAADRWYSELRIGRRLARWLVCRRWGHDWFDMGGWRDCTRCRAHEFVANKRGWY